MLSKETKQKLRDLRVGPNNPFYKDGRSTLEYSIKCLSEYESWRKSVLERDHYTCQKCYKKERRLEVHHIKEFHKILTDLLRAYSQFSPVEDKETLVRLAITYKPFWDVDNGQTLCRDCHNLTKCKTYLKLTKNKIK